MIGDDQNMRNYIKGPSRVGQPRASADGVSMDYVAS